MEHIKESATFEQPNFDVCLETARPIISIIAPKGHSHNGSRVLENLWKSTRATMIIWNLFTKLLFTEHTSIKKQGNNFSNLCTLGQIVLGFFFSYGSVNVKYAKQIQKHKKP